MNFLYSKLNLVEKKKTSTELSDVKVCIHVLGIYCICSLTLSFVKILHLIYKSLIHVEFIIVHGLRKVPDFILLQINSNLYHGSKCLTSKWHT